MAKSQVLTEFWIVRYDKGNAFIEWDPFQRYVGVAFPSSSVNEIDAAKLPVLMS